VLSDGGMKSMNEYLARRSNHEDGVKGRFWEGRFGCQRLLGEASILACMAYVDLNPVRAKIAESLEESEFTSAYDRLTAESAKRKASSFAGPTADRKALRIKAKREKTAKQLEELEENARARARASWLVDLDGPEGPIERLSERMYLRLVDLTGRQIREDKCGHISPEVTPILEALDIDAEAWVQNVENYGKLPDMRRPATCVGVPADAGTSTASPVRLMNWFRPPKSAA
jgi:hypothetical protein